MVDKDDVIQAALMAAQAAYDFDATDHETDEEANAMYHHMISQISKIPVLAVAEWRERNPESSMSPAEVLEVLYNQRIKSPYLRVH
jgi:hypothetical protein